MFIKIWHTAWRAPYGEFIRTRIVLQFALLLTLVDECIGASSNRSKPLELQNWELDNFVKCIFCLDYDDYHGLSIFGCSVKKPLTCLGNTCYMRQHKKNNFFLYTSGCLNFTSDEYDAVSERRRAGRVVRGATGHETQLCEVSSNMNTCICNNNDQCNNISSMEPFTELTTSLFDSVQFDELAHFRYFLPNDPLLKEQEMSDSPLTTDNEEYFMVRLYNNRYLQIPSCGHTSECYCIMLIFHLLLFLIAI
ncbi:Uncharacterized protein F46C5.2 [Toxocara canis]|uniref:Uncharacterized protein F46C5.2 n=2 Tax=Toxocara canis TaxID=6265 RepID=A0A0B2UUR6_TOXCA|nr:Uncharacterized protein F46C5.2 [Toxocara canis]VDM45479.1 unnamed protein product [Toxocara canis]